jgi:hypothetical protein
MVGGIDSDALIGDRHRDAMAEIATVDGHGRTGPEAEGVAEQVGEDVLEPRGVPVPGQVGDPDTTHRAADATRLRTEALDDTVDDGAKIDEGGVEANALHPDPPGVEHLLDESLHPSRRTRDRVECDGRRELPLQRLDLELQGREWRA